MAGKSNLAATLFAQKKLLNKAHTSILKSDAQEVIGSNIQPAAETTFGQTTQYDLTATGSTWFKSTSIAVNGGNKAFPSGSYSAIIEAVCVAK